MKVLMFVESLFQIGGMEKQAISLSQTLIRGGIQVKILSSCSLRRIIKKGFVERYQDVEVIKIPSFRFSKGLFYAYLRFLFSLYVKLRPRGFDILHVHKLTRATTHFGRICGKSGKKAILKIATGGGGGDISVLSKKYDREKILRGIQGYEKVVAISPEIKRELVDLGVDENNIVYIPNGVDTDKFRRRNSDKLKIRSRLNIRFSLCGIFVGRLVSRKNPIFLVDFLRILRDRFPEFGLLLIGDGEEKNNIIDLSRKYGLDDSIVLTGFVNIVENYLKASDFYVTASRYEGLSNSLLEAMSCSLPIIAPRTKSYEGIVIDGYNGFFYEPNDIEDACNKAEKILLDGKLRDNLGKASREFIEKGFSIGRIAEQYRELYEQYI
jgi:glycosyltransferase involved in cell wall biosynthesis